MIECTTELLQESNGTSNVSDVFHVHDSFVIHENRSNGPAETHRAYLERTFGAEARYDERNDEQPERHKALWFPALDTAPVESKCTGFV